MPDERKEFEELTIKFGKGLADHANLRRSELGSLLVWDGGNEHAYDCLHA